TVTQRTDLMQPHAFSAGEPMDQDERRPLPLDRVGQRDAVYVRDTRLHLEKTGSHWQGGPRRDHAVLRLRRYEALLAFAGRMVSATSRIAVLPMRESTTICRAAS